MICFNGDAASGPVRDVTSGRVRCVDAMCCVACVAFRMCDCVEKVSVVVFVKASCTNKPGAQCMLIGTL